MASRGGRRWGKLPLRLWRGFRAFVDWFRIRRLRFTRGGLIFSVGTLSVGFAAINTGNNLLYLLLGAMLGFMTVSGWLSEQAIRGLEVDRHTPRGVTVGHPARIAYHVRNRKSRIPTLALELYEKGLPAGAFLPAVAPGGIARARSQNHFVQRGVYPLRTLTLSTSFPFGLFRKERDLTLPGELVIWPRTDRKVREVAPGGGKKGRRSSALSPAGSTGSRGEYRGLKEYRPGDDPRDIHWRSTARLGEPVVREYEEENAHTLWICLDASAPPGEAAEEAVEIAASLAARASRRGRPFALDTPVRTVRPGSGPGQLERVLDALARVDFSPRQPGLVPVVDPAGCVLVTSTGRDAARFGDVVVAREEAR